MSALPELCDETSISPKRDLDTMESDVSTLLTTEGSSLKSTTEASSPEVKPFNSKKPKSKKKKTNVLIAVQSLTLNSPLTKSPLNSDSSQAGSPEPSFTYSVSPDNGSRDGLVEYTNSPIEDVGDKRERRLQRNRKAAQESRHKKKIFVTELETKIKVLKQDNEVLLQKILCLKNQLDSGDIYDLIERPSKSPQPDQRFHHQALLSLTHQALAHTPSNILTSQPASPHNSEPLPSQDTKPEIILSATHK